MRACERKGPQHTGGAIGDKTALRTIVRVLAVAALLSADIAWASHANRAGSVQTVAGAGYCSDAARKHRQSDAVGAVVVDPLGNLFFDSGPPARGFVARVDDSGQAIALVSGVPRGPGRIKASGKRITAPGPNRLAPDGKGGVFVAAGGRVVHLDAANSLTTAAGDPSAGPGVLGSGGPTSGSPAGEARFISARSLAPGPGGGLFISDISDARKPTFSVKFLNLTGDPVDFYRGTPAEISVAPAHIQTIAGKAAAGRKLPASGTGLRGASPTMAFRWPVLYVSSDAPAKEKGGGRPVILAINLSGEPASANGITLGPAERKIVAQASPPRSSDRPANRPRLRGITGLAAGSEGRLYVADEKEHRIFRIDERGKLSSIAGTGKGGFNGNDRRATGAKLNAPQGLDIGPDGRIYFSDRSNHQVRVIDRSGIVRAAPGNAAAISYDCIPAARGSSPALGQATDESALPVPSGPGSVETGPRGHIFFSLPAGNQVKRIDARGQITTVAGRSGGKTLCPGALGCAGLAGDGRPASRALLREPGALLAAAGGLYVWDGGNGRIRFINLQRRTVKVHGVAVRAGTINTVAGNGKAGPTGRPGRALSSTLGRPVTLSGSEVGYLERLGALRYKTAGPPDRLAASPLFAPGSLAADRSGNLFIADTVNKAVRRVDRSGKISTVAGKGTGGSLAACCSDPMAVAIHPSGHLFVADRAAAQSSVDPLKPAPAPSPRIWMVNLANRPATVMGVTAQDRSAAAVAGNGGFGFRGDGGSALQAELLVPVDLSFGPGGDLYIAETGGLAGSGGQVRVIDRAGIIKTVAGTGQKGFNGDGLKAIVTQLNYPAGVSVDRCGNMFIVDLGNERIRKVSGETDC